jgi:hypothetical protein
MTWSDANLLQRIDARCAALGITRHAACVNGGVDPSYLDRPVDGRQINKLEQLAAGLNWTLCQMIGCDSPTLAMPSVDRPLLEKAVRTAQRGLRNDPDSAELLPGTIADVYDTLIERQQSGEPIDDAYLAGIEGMIRRGRR